MRRLVIFQRISRQTINQPLEIPLAHHAAVLVTNGSSTHSIPTCNFTKNYYTKENPTMITKEAKDELESDSSHTNNTSLALSYL